MKLREFLVGTALISISLVTAKASVPVPNDEGWFDFGNSCNIASEESMSVPLVPEPMPLASDDKVLRTAYHDTLSILSTNNSCSDFFGGPGTSVDVFNHFISKVRKGYFPVSVGMKMSGPVINMQNAVTKSEYRLFGQVSINTNGPFYRKKFSHSEPTVPRIGPFEPNTKEVRVLIFLHELGHIVKGHDGHWLLPDDGKDEVLSRQNSQTIEEICGDQIKNLGKADTKPGLAARNRPAENVGQLGIKP